MTNTNATSITREDLFELAAFMREHVADEGVARPSSENGKWTEEDKLSNRTRSCWCEAADWVQWMAESGSFNGFLRDCCGY